MILEDASHPVATGLLPGFQQSINRSEVWAITMALRWAAFVGQPIEIWSDSQYACNGFKELLDANEVPQDWDNLDLWYLAYEWLQKLATPPVFHKVAAHRDPNKMSSPFEAWTARHNGLADTAAKVAVLTEGTPEFRTLWNELTLRADRNFHHAERFQDFLLELAQQGLEPRSSLADAAVEDSDDAEITLHGEVNAGDFVELFPVDVETCFARSPLLVSMGLAAPRALTSWFSQLNAEADFVLEITTLEACIGFLLDGHSLPYRVNLGSGPIWVCADDFPAGELLGHTLAAKHSAFLALLRAVSDVFGCEWFYGEAAKVSSGVHRRFFTLMIPWPLRLAHRVQATLQSFTARRPIRSAADMARTLQL